uniref:hypothetical protein n=1 Tax=Acetatifactor sp. TaxID=1872090 RepID=UPI0040570003
MIDYLVLAKDINRSEANFIKNVLHLQVKDANSWTTNAFRGNGFASIGVWINPEDINPSGYNRISTLNVIVNPNSFMNNGAFDIPSLLSRLDRIMANVNLANYDWRIQNIKFKKFFVTENADLYMDLLNKGHSLSSISMEKKMDNWRKPSAITYKSKSAKLCISSHDGMLDMTVDLYKRKLKELSKWMEVEKRNVKSYDAKMEEIEQYIWQYYISTIAGTGDYYSFKDAEDIIEKDSCKRKEKEIYYTILKGVQAYKGIEQFLSHVEDKEPRYEYMNTLTKLSTAKSYILKLEEKGINPVCISRRNSRIRDGKQMMPNILKCIYDL